MAKKGSFLKAALGIGSLAVAGKVVYDKYKNTKEKYVKEEDESKDDIVKKYNAIAESKVIELQDEEFEGCEIKAVASKVVLDLSLAAIEKDVYINFKSQASCVIIVLPEGINVTCDIEKVASAVKNEVENSEEEGIPTVYVIGTSNVSCVDIIPADFYCEDDDFEDDEDSDFVEEEPEIKAEPETKKAEPEKETKKEAEVKPEAEEKKEPEKKTAAKAEEANDSEEVISLQEVDD